MVARAPDVSRQRRPTANVQLDMTAEISDERLMAVMRDFDEFGGASLELVAWELGEPASRIEPSWSKLVAEGLIEPAGVDSVFGEPLWRLAAKIETD
jgi:hypothetical protein